MYKRGDPVAYRGSRGQVTQVGHDGTWVIVHMNGAAHGQKVPVAEVSPWVEPPAVTEMERADFALVRPLCDRCRFATARLCAYFRANDILLGIARVGCNTVACQLSGSHGLSFRVVRCEQHARGELPALGRVWERTV